MKAIKLILSISLLALLFTNCDNQYVSDKPVEDNNKIICHDKWVIHKSEKYQDTGMLLNVPISPNDTTAIILLAVNKTYGAERPIHFSAYLTEDIDREKGAELTFENGKEGFVYSDISLREFGETSKMSINTYIEPENPDSDVFKDMMYYNEMGIIFWKTNGEKVSYNISLKPFQGQYKELP